MNARLGPSIALSFLLVAAAAVALYRPETQEAPSTIETAAAPEVGTADRPRPRPRPTPGVPWPEAVAAAEARPRGERAVDPNRSGEAQAKAPRARAVSRRRPAAPAPARPSFTIVGPGESLADVARRVYGGEGGEGRLFLANRDQIERIDGPLRPGMLLRTP